MRNIATLSPTAVASGSSQIDRNTEMQHEFSFQTVGVVESCFPALTGTPRQGALVPSGKARIRLTKSLVTNGAVDGLAEYSHLWVVWVFHRNVAGKKEDGRGSSGSFKTKIRAPKLAVDSAESKTGVFATRSPHRPNPIGLSLVALDSVDFENGVLEISGLDMVDGTPVLDVKPYHPILDRLDGARAPHWVLSACSRDKIPVRFDDAARAQLEAVAPRLKLFNGNAQGAAAALVEALQLNVRDGAARAKAKRAGKTVDVKGQTFTIPFDTLTVTMRVEDESTGALAVAGVILKD